MDEVIAFNPDKAFNNALDLFNAIKDNTNIKLFTYKTEDIDSIQKSVPKLGIVKGTANLHEVTVKPDGKFYGKDTSFSLERLL
ncbi:unnamed protein product [Rotaria sp. Silwood1]|nr:unnamed protein product [Rotaria sp. Silwood1]